MGALFEIFATIVIALATATFAHLGVIEDAGKCDRDSREAPRAVKRSPVLPATGPTLVAAVRR